MVRVNGAIDLVWGIIFCTNVFVEGRAAMQDPGNFSRSASKAYQQIPSDEKDALMKESEGQRLTCKGIIREGKRIFGRIQKLVSRGVKCT